MSLISELLLSMQYELQDVAGNVYSSYVLMDTYNKGNKLLRKLIIDYMPMQLVEELPADATPLYVNAGEAITLPKKPIKIIDFRLEKRPPINKVSISEIPDRTATGEPRAYYLLGTNTIKLYPIPDKQYSYSVVYIPETTTMVETDDSGYQTDVEQLLVKYVVAVLSGKDFDLATEYQSISGLLSSIETGVTVVNGYYDSNYRGGDYNC